MDRKLTDKACKDIIKDIARKYKIDPRLIVTKLLSGEDKDDMRAGLLPIASLDCHVRAWIENGMPDLVA